MGAQFFPKLGIVMKLFVVLALFVAAAIAEPEAEAEADPAYFYSNYYSPYGYRSYGGYGWNPMSYGYYGYKPYGYNYGGNWAGYRFFKREAGAEAQPEAEADPAYFYSNYYNNNYWNPYTYGVYGHNIYNYANMYHNYAYAPYSSYHGYNRFFKREAEAEPEAEADPAYFYGNFYQPYAPHGGYASGWNKPYGYTYGLPYARYGMGYNWNGYYGFYKK